MATCSEETNGQVNETNKQCKIITVNRLEIPLRQEGYHYQFTDEAQARNYECMICLQIARPPALTPSCHTSCVSCWEDWKSENESIGAQVCCPTCMKIIGDRPVEEDEKISRIIKRLPVYCENKGNGCKEIFECSEVETHHKICDFQLVSCELECGASILLKNLPNHRDSDCPRRLESCSLCDDKMMHQDIEDHLKVCPKQKTICEYCGDTSLLNDQLVAHIEKDCESYPTYCSLAAFGCKEKIKRNELICHHNTQVPEHIKQLNIAVLDLHTLVGKSCGESSEQNTSYISELPLSMWSKMSETDESGTLQNNEGDNSLVQKVENLENFVRSLTAKQFETIASLDGQIKSFTKLTKSQTETIALLEEQIQSHKETISNQTENITELKEQMKSNKETTVNQTATIAELEEQIKSNKETTVNQTATIAELKEQIKSNKETTVNQTATITALKVQTKSNKETINTQTATITALEEQAKTHKQHTNNQIEKNTTIENNIKNLQQESNTIRLLVTPPFKVHKIFEDGPFIWTIPFFKNIIIQSKPFYTRKKFLFYLHIQKSIDKTTDDMYFNLLKGEYDDELEWPFKRNEIKASICNADTGIELINSFNRLTSTETCITTQYGEKRLVSQPFPFTPCNIKIIVDF